MLDIFVSELIKSPLKQQSISQSIFSAVHPRSVMPLQLGLAVATDNRLSSKWLSNILHKLGFTVSYDELIRYREN